MILCDVLLCLLRVVECSDLLVVNGACNPYAIVTLSWGKLKHKEVKRTSVRKKTICPHFDEVFCFDVSWSILKTCLS